VRGRLAAGLTIFAVARDGDRLNGLLRLGIDPDEPNVLQTVDTPDPIPWTETSTLVVTRVERGRATSRAWPMLDEVRGYP